MVYSYWKVNERLSPFIDTDGVTPNFGFKAVSLEPDNTYKPNKPYDCNMVCVSIDSMSEFLKSITPPVGLSYVIDLKTNNLIAN